jgi:hypothetical protein
MGDPSIAVQTALITKYRADTTLQALMTSGNTPEWSIYEQGGSGAIVSVFPSVFVHPITSQLGSTFAFGKDAMDLYVQVSVFTRFLGFAQARAIIARIYTLTHGPIAGQLTLSGFSNVLTLFDNRQELEETTDVLVQHIADRYKIVVQG